jgi:hypothetical protein
MLPSLDLHSFGGSRHRAAISSFPSFGRQRHRAAISSFVWPAHRSPHHNHFSGPVNHIAVPRSFQRSGESHRRTNINNNNNNNNTQRHHLRHISSFGRRIDRRATIFSVGQRIPSPRRNHFSGPENPIAAPHSFLRAGESHCRAAIFSSGRRIDRRAAIFSTGRRIPSPRRNLFIGPANLIAAPQSFPRAGESHRRAGIFSSGR